MGQITSSLITLLLDKDKSKMEVENEDKKEAETVTKKEKTFFDTMREGYLNYFDNLIICVQDDKEIPVIFSKLFKYLRNSGNLIIFALKIHLEVFLHELSQ